MATTAVDIANLALSRIGADTITSLTADAAKEDRLCNQFYEGIRNELLTAFQWNFAMKAARLILTDGFDTSTAYSDAIAITNVATTNPVVITAVNNYATGMMVLIYSVSGTEELNDLSFEVTGANTASFALKGIDGGKYTTYLSGGSCIRSEPLTLYSTGYTYDLPGDCLKPIGLDSGAEFEIYGDDPNGKRLLTTDDEAVLKYVSLVTDVSLYPVEFVDLLVSRLARELAMPILGARDGMVLRRDLTEDVRSAAALAKKIQTQSQTKWYKFKSTWADARK